MATSKWIASTRAGAAAGWLSLETTSFNSLANDAGVLSAVIDNTAALDTYCDLELYVSSWGSAPVADKTVDVYFVRSTDGTNYEDNSAARPPINGSAGSFVLDNIATANRHVIPGILLPPGKFKLLIVNKSGFAMAASGNILSGLFYNQQVG